ncbi:hypothetical protein QR685DRAFT_531310 [Neurospora intermedia]|uniref:Uncharacterized protein n=1 Tax=Neurospora intermedia TaxID=5142 RepID=A0ABR3D7D3_NEUIN
MHKHKISLNKNERQYQHRLFSQAGTGCIFATNFHLSPSFRLTQSSPLILSHIVLSMPSVTSQRQQVFPSVYFHDTSQSTNPFHPPLSSFFFLFLDYSHPSTSTSTSTPINIPPLRVLPISSPIPLKTFLLLKTFPHVQVEHKARTILDSRLCIPSGTSKQVKSPMGKKLVSVTLVGYLYQRVQVVGEEEPFFFFLSWLPLPFGQIG